LILLYFAVQLPLSIAILYLSRITGFMSLIVFPLASNALELLPRRQAVAVWVLSFASFVAVNALLYGWLSALSNSPAVAAGILFVSVFTYFAIREREGRAEVERLAAELQTANTRLREYAAQVEELATIQERNRLAREIHDSLGHYLTVINVQLEAAQALVTDDPPRATTALRKAQSLAQEGLADVRRSVAALRAAPNDGRPLPEALGQLVAETRAAGILTHLEVLGQPRALAAQTEQTLYRAAQEALTNVRKHARASRADLTLDYAQADRLRLVIQDNGIGAAETAGGFGLLGLRERAALVGGSLAVQSAPGQGFRVEIEAPG
jgi:signal transduction histidine kinase